MKRMNTVTGLCIVMLFFFACSSGGGNDDSGIDAENNDVVDTDYGSDDDCVRRDDSHDGSEVVDISADGETVTDSDSTSEQHDDDINDLSDESFDDADVSEPDDEAFPDIDTTPACSPEGTTDCPIVIASLPYIDERDTNNAESDEYDTYPPDDIDASGQEFIYMITVSERGVNGESIDSQSGIRNPMTLI